MLARVVELGSLIYDKRRLNPNWELEVFLGLWLYGDGRW